MKIIESWGVSKIERYYSKMDNQIVKYDSIYELFQSHILTKYTILAFLIGFGLTVPLIFIELRLDIFNISTPNVYHILIYLITLVVLVFLEFYLLFSLGLYTIAYYARHLYYIRGDMHITQKEFIAMLSRTVMELPEDNIIRYNINHNEYRDKDIILITFIYKLKVIVSNILLKFITKQLLTRSGLRVYSAYIASIGTGLWDAITFYKTIKHSQYKIMARYSILYLIETKIDTLSQSHNIKAILARYYHYNEYNNNIDLLLGKIFEYHPFDYTKESFLSGDTMDNANQNLLIFIFSLKEKLHNKREKKIIKALCRDKEIKSLRYALANGDLDYLKEFIDTI